MLSELNTNGSTVIQDLKNHSELIYYVLGSRLLLWSDCAKWERGIARVGREDYLGNSFCSVSSSGCWFHGCVHFMKIIKLQACDLCISLNICYILNFF